MNRTALGLLTGVVAGTADAVPMILQKLPLEADLSAFSMWVVIGLLLSGSKWKMNGVLKGIIVSFLTLLPSAILIGWKEPVSLLPISIMTLILGGLSGFVIDKLGK